MILNVIIWTDIFTTITAIAAVFVAIISLRLTIKTKKDSIKLTEIIATNNVKPLISSIRHKNKKFCGVKIENFGMGTAVIKGIELKKSGNQTKDFRKLFSIPENIWTDWSNFMEEEYYLKSGEVRFLGKIKKIDVEKMELNYEEISNHFDEELSGIEIKFEYEDVFGNKQNPYRRIFVPRQK